jgi:hypothetical protein
MCGVVGDQAVTQPHDAAGAVGDVVLVGDEHDRASGVM